MIKSFEITNNLGESIILDLADPYKTGLAIESVKGLNPVKADIRTKDIVTMDGSIYNGSRSSKRNIVFKFIFLEAETIEETRLRCYKYFPIQGRIDIKIRTDNREVRTYGYVENIDTTIFSKDTKKSSSSVEYKCGAQVSIVCPDSYFRLTDTNTNSVDYIENKFEFPFSKDVDDDESIIFGQITNNKQLIINYEGAINTGINICIDLKGPIDNFIIYNVTNKQQMIVYSELICYYLGIKKIESGDRIIISTEKGNKYIYFCRNGNYYNIMGCINISSDWIELQRGLNRFELRTANDKGYENISMTINNEILLEGI